MCWHNAPKDEAIGVSERDSQHNIFIFVQRGQKSTESRLRFGAFAFLLSIFWLDMTTKFLAAGAEQGKQT